jgi:ubiquinol-cytochrome c reductase cytochrome c1 subunit
MSQSMNKALKKLLLAAGLMSVTATGFAASAAPLYEADVNLQDRVSLQRGARTFVNFCLSCHSAAFSRFSRVAKDLDIPEPVVAENMMFVTDKIGNTMTAAMRGPDAETWFGVPPPDLSVVARARGADWLYTFLLTFYQDPARPTGVNNVAFRDTAMPHVLWELQGVQRPVYKAAAGHDGTSTQVLDGFEVAIPGRQTAAEYRQTVADLVNFLVYLGEPAQLHRYRIGAIVIIFLFGFLVLAYQLKKEYWNDVH